MRQRMQVLFVTGILFILLCCTGCEAGKQYTSVDQQEAIRIMSTDGKSLIVDVRTKEEYDQGHIVGAVLVPSTDILEGKVDALPDKDQKLFLYCRTGRRAEDAAQKLTELGYTNVYEMGGILNWNGAVVKE